MLDSEKVKRWVRDNSFDAFSRDDINLFRRVPETFDDWEMFGSLPKAYQFKPRLVDAEALLKYLDQA